MAALDSTPAIVANEGNTVTPAKLEKKQNKDLQRTKLCAYFLEGKCGYGTSCTFAHSVLEVKDVPDLTKTQLCKKFAEGKCTDPNCSFAHGEAELRDPPNFKKKFCKWHSKGKCRNGTKCGFAHDMSELRAVAPPGFEPLGNNVPHVPKSKKSPKLAAPPGLTKMGDDNDCDASSTDVPSSNSQVETDFSETTNGVSSMPEEHLFRFMAGRGSAPLQQQVALMGSAIGGLQAKLSQLEDMMLQTQVAQMQQSIQQLTEQCWALENGMTMPEQPMGGQTSFKSRLNVKAVPFMPGSANDMRSEDSTSVGSE